MLDCLPTTPFSQTQHVNAHLLIPMVQAGLVCVLAGACTTTAPVNAVMFESARGTVFLQKTVDRSFQASHPTTIHADLIARLLAGIQVQDQQRSLQTLLAGKPVPVPVFSEEDIRFLAPQLATAFSKAAPDQSVGFTLISRRDRASSEGTSLATTVGSLNAYGTSIHFSLTQYRYDQDRTDSAATSHRRLPDTSGLANRVVLFFPEAARRPDSDRRIGTPETTVVIDSEILAKLATASPANQATANPRSISDKPTAPAAQPADHSAPLPGQPPTTTEDLRALKDQMLKKDSEVEALRKELADIRRQLTEQKAERDKPKRKPTPSRRSPE